MKILIGSTALKHNGYNRLEAKDIDIWTDFEFNSMYDCKHQPKSLLDLIETSVYPTRELGEGMLVASPDSIYTIKCSHLGWDVHWQKTKLDILHLSRKGCNIIPDLYEACVKQWKEIHGNKTFLSLDKDNHDFFNDHVKYIYDHDHLHELVSYPYKPMYQYITNSVMTSKDLFDDLTYGMKVKLFREEITVIAVERWMLHDKNISWYAAYNLSLKKTITNLTKNWACDFISKNLRYFVKPDYSYFKHILEELNMNKKVNLEVFERILKVTENIPRDFENLDSLIYRLVEDEWSWILKDAPELSDITVAVLAKEGGGEGGSEYCYAVFSVNDTIYACDYSYYSYEGHNFDGIADTLREVTPSEKTITVYT